MCGQSIDYNAIAGTKWSYTYDHIHAIAKDGHVRGEGRPAHRSCNARRGNNEVPKTATSSLER
ncbi:HNH endonuclease [Dermabacter vaginalis]|uniref:HNH endonuclease n=1 Tax=Dermabacter vaginalis TaxID=1630135 RepID=A0ABX6A8I1_9MICO|nr:HNH endonuclease [Dermabacter vaginalis]